MTYSGGMDCRTSSCGAAPSDTGSSSPRGGTVSSGSEISRSECMSVDVTWELEGSFAIMNK